MLKRLMNIKIIRLVADEELVPVAVLDYLWDKLLNEDYSQSQDW